MMKHIFTMTENTSQSTEFTPRPRKGIFLIAHTAFPGNGEWMQSASNSYRWHNMPSSLEPGNWRLMLEMKSQKQGPGRQTCTSAGLPSTYTAISKALRSSTMDDDADLSVTEHLIPGSIALFETWIPGAEHADGFDNNSPAVQMRLSPNSSSLISTSSCTDVSAEERDSSNGQDGVYSIPNHGPLVYAGLQGWWSLLERHYQIQRVGTPTVRPFATGTVGIGLYRGSFGARQASKEWILVPYKSLQLGCATSSMWSEHYPAFFFRDTLPLLCKCVQGCMASEVFSYSAKIFAMVRNSFTN